MNAVDVIKWIGLGGGVLVIVGNGLETVSNPTCQAVGTALTHIGGALATLGITGHAADDRAQAQSAAAQPQVTQAKP